MYPVSKIAMCGSIYMTVAISAHRFVCIVRNPSFLQKKSWIFNFPVLIFSILINIPTFLNYELKYKENNSTGETIIQFKPTELRNNEDFKYQYIYLTQNIGSIDLLPHFHKVLALSKFTLLKCENEVNPVA